MNDKIDNTFSVGNFIHHVDDEPTEQMKMLIVEDLSNNWFCCRYIHYKKLGVGPHRKLHASEIIQCVT